MSVYIINLKELKLEHTSKDLAAAEAMQAKTKDPTILIDTWEDVHNMLKATQKKTLLKNLGHEGNAPRDLRVLSQTIYSKLDKEFIVTKPKKKTAKQMKGSKGSKKKTSKKKTAAKKASGAGYKGHREGSRKEQAHKIYDQKGMTKTKYVTAVTKLGIKETTAKSWAGTWGGF